MSNIMMATVVLGIIAYGIISIINEITSYKLKKRLIEKAQVNEDFHKALAESMKAVTQGQEKGRYPSLKWGLVFLGAGVGLILTQYLVHDYYNSPLPFGLLLSSISLGFLIYYFVVRAEDKKAS